MPSRLYLLSRPAFYIHVVVWFRKISVLVQLLGENNYDYDSEHFSYLNCSGTLLTFDCRYKVCMTQ